MSNIIPFDRSKQIPDITCGYCGKRVQRSKWVTNASWSWWCKDGKHGPLAIEGKGATNSLMDEKVWLK